MRDRYVRPPLVGLEPRSGRGAVWRFRLLALLVLAAAAFVAVLLVRTFTGQAQDPGVGGLPALPAAASVHT